MQNPRRSGDVDSGQVGFGWLTHVFLVKMAMKMLNPGGHKLPRIPRHTVRFSGDDILPNSKVFDSPNSTTTTYGDSSSHDDSGAPSPDVAPQPAMQRYRINEQRIKLLQSINQVVQHRAELENNRVTLLNLLDELRRKLKRRIDECHYEKKEKMKALKQANLKLEKEKFGIVNEIEHLKKHLVREEAHHVQHAKAAVAQADSKLAAARLMRDIAELRHRVSQVEARLASELKRKRQAEVDIVRLRKELSSTKSYVASLRTPGRQPCSKFA